MKKIVIIIFLATSSLWGAAEKNNPEFDRLMEQFTRNFQKFTHVYVQGAASKEKKDIYTLASKALESSVNLYVHVKKNPHEKRFVPLEHRKALENTLHQLPKPSKKDLEFVQKKQIELNTLCQNFIRSAQG